MAHHRLILNKEMRVIIDEYIKELNELDLSVAKPIIPDYYTLQSRCNTGYGRAQEFLGAIRAQDEKLAGALRGAYVGALHRLATTTPQGAMAVLNQVEYFQNAKAIAKASVTPVTILLPEKPVIND